MKHYFCAGTTFKGETPFLREWIEYHRIVGASHLYMVNHDEGEARVESSALLKPYVDAGIVTELFHDDRSLYWQYYSWMAITEAAEGQTEWLLLTDADAFLFPMKGLSVIPYLQSFERPEVAGLAVYTCTFGTNNRKTPPKLQIEELTGRAPMSHVSNWTANYVLRQHLCLPSTSKKYADPKPGCVLVDTDNTVVSGIAEKKRDGPKNKLRLNHYSLKSEQDWHRKAARGWPGVTWDTKAKKKTLAQHKKNMLDHNDEQDRSMDRFVPLVKKALQL